MHAMANTGRPQKDEAGDKARPIAPQAFRRKKPSAEPNAEAAGDR